MKKNIGLLTCSSHPNLTDSDRNLVTELARIGIFSEILIWDSHLPEENLHDALVFRSVWDYFRKKELFLEWLKKLDTLGIKTFNSTSIVRWNLHKAYLKDLEAKGVKILPTIIIKKNQRTELTEIIPEEWKSIVVKPAISANAYQTEILLLNETGNARYVEKDHDLIVQKYIPEITSQGEVSLIFFDKKFSHAVLKIPKAGDFRTQGDYGGIHSAYSPSIKLINTAEEILRLISEDLLYARVDGINMDGEFHLMELELIEPNLYFNHHANSYDNFISAICKYLT